MPRTVSALPAEPSCTIEACSFQLGETARGEPPRRAAAPRLPAVSLDRCPLADMSTTVCSGQPSARTFAALFDVREPRKSGPVPIALNGLGQRFTDREL